MDKQIPIQNDIYRKKNKSEQKQNIICCKASEGGLFLVQITPKVGMTQEKFPLIKFTSWKSGDKNENKQRLL